MSKIVRIPEHHLILVCNARKAVFLKNAGHLAQPELQVDSHFDFGWIKEDQLSSDRAGRRFDGGAAGRSGGSRSAMELPDLEAKHSEDVAEQIFKALAERYQKSPFSGLLIVAPPSLLGVLRQKMNRELRDLVVDEIGKDLAEMPVHDIQNSLLKAI